MPKMPKSPAQLDRDIAEALSTKKSVQSRSTKAATYEQRLLEDAIESVYDRKGSEDLTLEEACEAVREMLPSRLLSPSDKTITATIKRQIPDWF